MAATARAAAEDRDGGIVEWDADEGTVRGTSALIAELSELMRHKEIEVPLWPYIFRLKNAKHDPADFMILLLHVGGGGEEDYGLPPLLAEADLTKVQGYRFEDSPG